MNYKKYFFSYWNYIKNIPKRKMVIYIMVLIIAGGGVFLVAQNIFKADVSSEEPAAPTNLTATDNDAKTQISLSWTDNSSDESGFIIERTPNFEQDFSEITTLSPGVVNYSDTIEAGKRYYYRVKAINSIGSSIYSNIATPKREDNNDLLLSHGYFESSNQTVWGYTDSNNVWRSGTKESTANDSVASDWMRITSASLEQGTNFTYQLNAADGFDGNSQIVTLKNLSSGYNYAGLFRGFSTDDTSSKKIDSGDTVTFGFDKIVMENYSSLPVGTTIRYYLQISTYDQNGHMQGGSKDLDLTPSQTPQSHDISILIPANCKSIHAHIFMSTIGDLGNSQPSLRVDDAHLYIKKAGNSAYNTLEIPAPRDRNINTQRVFFNPWQDDTYENAKNFDSVSGGAANYDQMKVLKYYNPNIKIVGYTASTFADARSASYVDPTVSYAPIPFGWALEQQKNSLTNDWFFSYPPNVGPLESVRDTRSTIAPGSSRLYENDGTTPIPYIFMPEYQDRYPANLNSSTYREDWIENIVKIYSKNKFDSMFLDDTVPIKIDGTRTDPITGVKTTVNIVDIKMSQIQSFINYVVPRIHAQLPNLEIIHNAASQHYNDKVAGTYGWPGKTFLNPIWKPTDETPGLNGAPSDFNASEFSANTFGTTSNTFFQEFAYVNLDWVTGNMNNRYVLHAWLMSIDDIDMLAQINNQTNDEAKKKRLYQSMEIMDRPDIGNYVNKVLSPGELSDLSNYDTGWAPFVLSSFLLNNNKYASLGVMRGDGIIPAYANKNKIVDPGWETTVKLGDAVSDRKIIYNNVEYSFDDPVLDSDTKKILQYREFENGLVVVNGSPDENKVFKLKDDYLDNLSRDYSNDSQITLLPHTARIFYTKVEAPIITPPVTPPTTTSPAATLSLPIDRFSTGWNMSSFPDLTSITNNVLGLATSSGFKLRSYNGTSNSYTKGDDGNMSLAPGKGYWLKIDNINKINGLKYTQDQTSSTETSVAKGWNLLGNPYQSDLPLSNLTVKYKDGTTRSYTDAIARKEVTGYGWSWEASSKQYYFIAITPNEYKTAAGVLKQTVINPYRGFWILIKSDNINSVTMNR